MSYESDVTAKTWIRTIDIIKKVGYSDGVVDAEEATFQTSFDMGYSQGLEFGLKLGTQEANRQRYNNNQQLLDTRRINCQICINGNSDKKNFGDLYNIQKEKNDDYLLKSE